MISLAHELFMSEHYPVTLSKAMKIAHIIVQAILNIVKLRKINFDPTDE